MVCFRVIGDNHSEAKEYGLAAADLPELSARSALADQQLQMCLADSPESPLSSPADLATVISEVAGVQASKVAYVSMARPSGAGYAVLRTDDLAGPDFLHREGCSDRPLVFLDGGRISYLRPQRNKSDDNALDYLSTEGGHGPLIIVVHTSGAFLVPEFTVSGELRAGSAITITATNQEFRTGWEFKWACASAGQLTDATTAAVTCTWPAAGSYGVALTAQHADGSMAYGTTSVRVGAAAAEPTPGASSTPTGGATSGAVNGGGSGTASPTGRATSGSGSNHHSTATASARPSATATRSATASASSAPSIAVVTPTATPRPAPASTAEVLTGYLLTTDAAASPAPEPAGGTDQVRSGGGEWLTVPAWLWGLGLGLAALLAGALGESWWLFGTRPPGPGRHRLKGAA